MANRHSQEIVLAGGLGNQLFQIAFGMNLMKYGKVSFLSGILRIDDSVIDKLVLPSSVNIEVFTGKSIFKKLYGWSLRSSTLPGKIGWLAQSFLSKILNITISGGTGFDGNLTKKSNSSRYIGYFQTYKWVNTPEVLLQMKSISIKEVSPWLKTNLEKLKSTDPVIMHVRLGDYANNHSIGILPTKYYEKALNYLFNSMLDREIWILSDEPHHAIKFVPPHLRKFTRVIQENEADDAQVFELMRNGRRIIIANSTFSWWAALLSAEDDKTILAPSKWFRHMETPRDLFPKEWITINNYGWD